MDKKKIQSLMKKRNPIERETMNPVDILSAETLKQQNSKRVEQQNIKTVNQLYKFHTFETPDNILIGNLSVSNC